ncbi:MAG: uroporphyrinogen decarboxylase family protein [Thermoproteota archaeon]
MKDIVDLGFNGVHSLQPSAGVNIIEIKRTWGSRICLMGNVDLDYLLTLSSPREVETEVKRLIREVAPGGGYILSTTNVLTRYVPTENAIAMYRTAEEFGSYPIKISE